MTISYGAMRAEFSGDAEEVLASVNTFLSKEVPGIDLARSIFVNYSLTELVQMFPETIKMTPEGPRVWVANNKLSDKEVVALQLIAAKIGHGTGRSRAPAMNLSELQGATSLNPKSISSRLSELAKIRYIEKEASDTGVQYRITAQGIHWLNAAISKKTKRPQQM